MRVKGVKQTKAGEMEGPEVQRDEGEKENTCRLQKNVEQGKEREQNNKKRTECHNQSKTET